ncbi:Spx/MgsR family RNA polymerase-binding regulatory protein [Nitrosomonas ureae]|uniref:Arsenate reductase n=1 Tax=Nitrosomonas ureae TaxID=44577 RepID=A0A1H5VSP7_9PROT|nr:Spx/MgsR family RNA polymerase-binding regulatory protein [Nitrosomonas ureae]SEF90345.1 arsenate reductase [Nitrosomonas ureae]
MLKFYGYKKCDTCRKAERYLLQAGISYEFIDITENPPTAEELAVIVKCVNVSLSKLFNTSGVQYRELKIKAQLPALSGKEILTLLAGNGRLVKRPLITDGKRATVGFNAEKFADIWG